ncbi:MAG TPA: hypothetical protein VFY89_07030 [Ktedonobacterales bacterium]
MRTLLSKRRPRARGWRAWAGSRVLLVGMLALLLVGCAGELGSGSGSPVGVAVKLGTSDRPAEAPFDPNVDAPLPNNRIITAYGIFGGVVFNGPASHMNTMLDYLPKMQKLAQQFYAADPTHPVKLGIDIVVNVLQPCSYFPEYCTSWAPLHDKDNQDSNCDPKQDFCSIDGYIKFCQEHDLLLFFDLQLGTEPVKHAVETYLLDYLQKYPFTELALDTEFHFPNTPQGRSEAYAYPNYTGQMPASEINWASNELAQISLKNHLPRKVLLVHEFISYVLPDKDKIQVNPNVSLVLQADGFGGYQDKLTKYQVFVQQQLIQYGGYKLFYYYTENPNCPGVFCATDFDENGTPGPPTPKSLLQNLFPQPLFFSYE